MYLADAFIFYNAFKVYIYQSDNNYRSKFRENIQF